MKKFISDYTSPITWTIIFIIVFFFIRVIYLGFQPKSDYIFYEDIEIGLYDSIRDTKNFTKVGDTLVIREHSWGKGKTKIWGKYRGYTPEGGPVSIETNNSDPDVDMVYYIYYNVVVRIK